MCQFFDVECLIYWHDGIEVTIRSTSLLLGVLVENFRLKIYVFET